MTHFAHRSDAVWHQGRRFVPTIYGEAQGNTVWLDTFADFKAAGGVQHFNEDQTEIVLTLPEQHKFSIQFGRRDMAAGQMAAALVLAASFMAGFEGDELQEGIDERLATVRAAIAVGTNGAPLTLDPRHALVADLARLSDLPGFDEMDDDRLESEIAAFRSFIRRAKALVEPREG